MKELKCIYLELLESYNDSIATTRMSFLEARIKEVEKMMNKVIDEEL